MLLLWRDRLQIVLTPEYVTVMRMGKGWKPRVLFNKTSACDAPSQGQPIWHPALQAMQQLLAQAGANKADAIVMLSNHFVRYQLIEAQADLASLDEEQGFVRFSFAETYGAEVDRWALRWSEGLEIGPQVASAVDQTLLDQIEYQLSANNINLVSVQPYFMAAFNHVRKAFSSVPGWFVLVEPGRACLGRLKEGDWQSLRAVNISDDWASELPELIKREEQISCGDTQQHTMMLCLPAHFDFKRIATASSLSQVVIMTPKKLINNTVSFNRMEGKL